MQRGPNLASAKSTGSTLFRFNGCQQPSEFEWTNRLNEIIVKTGRNRRVLIKLLSVTRYSNLGGICTLWNRTKPARQFISVHAKQADIQKVDVIGCRLYFFEYRGRPVFDADFMAGCLKEHGECTSGVNIIVDNQQPEPLRSACQWQADVALGCSRLCTIISRQRHLDIPALGPCGLPLAREGRGFLQLGGHARPRENSWPRCSRGDVPFRTRYKSILLSDQ
jgi:hypothetical protein